MKYWHSAARLMRAYIDELRDTESALSEEVIVEGKAHRHWRQVAADAQEHIENLEAELVQARADLDRTRAGLKRAAADALALRDSLQAAMPVDCSELFGRDMCGHINLMAGHGDPDYLMKNGKSVRHIDLRERKPRTKKEAA